MPITAIVFDFDGVLADTEMLHLRATQDAVAARGWTIEERTYFDRFLGYGDRDLIAELAQDAGETLDDEAIATLVAAKGRQYRDRLAASSAMYPTAADCISRLGDRFVLGIASGSLHAEIVDILDAAGLRSAFKAIVGADDCSAGKPAAEPYVRATKQLGVLPGAAVAIEDSRWGLESARSAGLRTIGITTSYPASALTMADLVVSSLNDITVGAIHQLKRP